MKTQTFGVELEMTGITRKTAAGIAADYFGTTSKYIGGSYDKYTAKDGTGRIWSFVSDASIHVERGKNGEGQQVEMVTPILRYEDIETLQELIRRIRKAGAITNSSCGIHIHIGADQHTPKSLRNLVNIFTSKQDIIFKALSVDSDRQRYCKKLENKLSESLNKSHPNSMNKVADIWYAGYSDSRNAHYNPSRYHAVNLHSVFTKGTVEFRCFNSTLHAGKSQVQSEAREPYTDDEIEMILSAAKPNTRLYAFINIALYTGMRPSEIRVLRWSDIDWDNGTIHVNGAAKRKYDNLERSKYTEYVGETKSKNGIRAIALAESAAAALKAWRAVSAHDPMGKDSAFIFFDEAGDFMKEEAFTSMWGRFIKSHGWNGKKYFIYRFRHTFCTRLLLSGCTPQMVQALMGDSTLNVIMRIYNGIKSKDVIEVTRDSVNGIYGAA